MENYDNEMTAIVFADLIERVGNYAWENVGPDDSPVKSFLKGVECMLNEMPFLKEEVSGDIVRSIAFNLYESDCEGFWDSSDLLD